MDQVTLLLAVLIAVAFALSARGHSRYEILIRIREGQPQLQKGKVRHQKWNEVTRTCHIAGIERGWIGIRQRPDHSPTFAFSRNIPSGPRQQFRNLWHAVPD